jgi:hypothetical protein
MIKYAILIGMVFSSTGRGNSMITVEAGKSRAITLDVLSTFKGHKPIYVEDPDNDAERVKLAEQVQRMIKEGFDLFLIDQDRITRRIKDYDATANEWILFSRRVETPEPPDEEVSEESATPKRRGRPKKDERVAAEGTTAGAVARTAGG